MRNRVIVVPFDKEEEEKLEYGGFDDLKLLKLDIVQFDIDYLYHSQILDSINEISGVMIDDYEIEAIYDKNSLEKSLAFLEDFNSLRKWSLVEQLIALFREAINRNTGVHFIF